MKSVQVTFTCKQVPTVFTETVEVPDTMTTEEITDALTAQIKELQARDTDGRLLEVDHITLVVQK